jgi:Domain of unknown function (DUF5658)
MPASVLPAVWVHFIINLLLQALDGFLSYRILSTGVPEANPFVKSAIAQWGTVWGLLYWKIFACVLLALIFGLRERQRALIAKALALTAVVYAYVSVAGLCMLLLEGLN